MTRRLALTLLAAAALLAAVGVAAFRDRSSSRLTAVFPSAGGLREGAPVTYLGVQVGLVEAIDLRSGRVVATLHVRRRDVVLRARDSVRLRTMGLLGGDAAVDITPGPRDAPPLGAQDTLFGEAVASAAVNPAKALEAFIPEAVRDSIRRDTRGRAGPAATDGRPR